MTRRQHAIVRALLLYSLGALIVTWVSIPLLYIAVASVQPERNLLSLPLKVSLNDFSLQFYGEALHNDVITRGLANSAIVASLSTALVLVMQGEAARLADWFSLWPAKKCPGVSRRRPGPYRKVSQRRSLARAPVPMAGSEPRADGRRPGAV